MADNKEKIEQVEEVEKEEKVTKPRGRKPKAQKEVEIVDSVLDDDEDDNVDIAEPVVVKKDYRQLRKELRGKKQEIEVELLHINSGGTSCRDRGGRVIFDFDNYGEREFLSLADVYEIATKYTNFFAKHQIVIVDLDTDEYTIDDIIEFLGLNELYDEIENYDTDYVSQILKLKYVEFEEVVKNASEDLIRILASRAVELYNNNKFDSKKKETLLAEKLNVENLFE